MTHEFYMRRAIQLAKNGLQNARPNPMVGAVIVNADGRIIGEGYHVRCGEGHAEVNAFADCQRRGNDYMLPEATMYVSLEPCAHYGKTPPCADLIVRKGVKRVVVGCVDTFSKVSGRGIERIREAGIEVIVGVCEEECIALNRTFFTFHNQHRPFITLKWAQSLDGFIDKDFQPCRISNEKTAMLAHKLRTEHDSILVGGITARRDNPSLTVREWYGKAPNRFILSKSESANSFTLSKSEPANGFTRIANLKESLSDGTFGASLLVEGGAQTHRHFIEQGLWDVIRVETAPILLYNGTKAATLPTNAKLTDERTYDGNTIRFYSKS